VLFAIPVLLQDLNSFLSPAISQHITNAEEMLRAKVTRENKLSYSS
jgi:hypothetical protein